ncbi:hypothetical protein LEMLEM_LOCUS7091, partial [Lemmus lemmus]
MASSSIQGNHILQQILEFFCGSGDISECYGRPYLPRRSHTTGTNILLADHQFRVREAEKLSNETPSSLIFKHL